MVEEPTPKQDDSPATRADGQPSLTVTRTMSEPCHVRLEIEVPAERVRQAFHGAVKRYRGGAPVPGFRPGKAPKALLIRRYGKQLREDAKERLLREAVRDACGQEQVVPETTPRIQDEDDILFVEDAPLDFSVDFDIAPSFELPDYQGVKVSCEQASVNDESVQEVIDSFLRGRASYEKVERRAQQGDLLKVTYHAQVGADVDVPETAKFLLDAEETWLALREPEIIPGAAEALVGVEAGEQRQVDVVFPDDYGENALAGTSVRYMFHIVEVHATQIPELTDEIARQIGAEDSEQVRERVRANLEADAAQQRQRLVRQRVVTALTEQVDFPIPPVMLSRETYESFASIYRQELRSGTTQDALKERQKELMAQAGETARQRLKRYYLFSRIAEQEDISVSREDLASAVEAVCQLNGTKPKAMLRQLQQSGRISDLVMDLRESKAIDRVVSLAEITDHEADEE